MPSSFSNILSDYFYNVTGISRKRSRYRCEKRGEDFGKYEKNIKDSQRKIGKPAFDERMKLELQKPNLFSMIEKDSTWKGTSLLVPFYCEWAKRKRSKYRNKK